MRIKIIFQNLCRKHLQHLQYLQLKYITITSDKQLFKHGRPWSRIILILRTSKLTTSGATTLCLGTVV